MDNADVMTRYNTDPATWREMPKVGEVRHSDILDMTIKFRAIGTLMGNSDKVTILAEIIWGGKTEWTVYETDMTGHSAQNIMRGDFARMAREFAYRTLEIS